MPCRTHAAEDVPALIPARARMRVAHAPRPLNLLVAKAGSCRASLFANPIAATSDRSPQAIVRVVATERSQLWVKPHCAERKTWATSGSHTLTGKPVPHDCYMESSPWSFPAQEALTQS